MLNEHDRDDGPEDGEYHFSDEGGYETNVEEEEGKAPVITESSNLAAKFSSYRRFVIIGAIFAGVLLVVYLIIPPLTTSVPTEITAVNNPPPAPSEMPVEAAVVKSAPVSAKPVAEVQPVPAPQPAVQPTQAQSQPAPQPSSITNLISAEKEKLMAERNAVITRIESPVSKPSPPSTVITVPPNAEAAATAPANPPAIGSQDFVTAPVNSMFVSAQEVSQSSAENKAVIERLTAMEEANTKVIGQLHAQYSQKIADYEARDKALQDQIQTLNGRLSSMEAEMHKLVHALNRQQASAPTPAAESGLSNLSESNGPNLQNPPIISGNPQMGYNNKAGYSVQAIIPGRAWLRTESGETITVAEGDMLKSLGRVTKIDPYDGIIQIDTGSRVITLTYGNGEYT